MASETSRGCRNPVIVAAVIGFVAVVVGAVIQALPGLIALLKDSPTLTPLEAALQGAANFTGSNTDWEPFTYTFDDPVRAEMVLVPVGGFTMGSENGNDDELPVHEQVFTTPFWIDRTEVTRGQYAMCVAAGACTETLQSDDATRDTQPINQVTWFQARAYCAWRGARLPTEAEWEYAARGPAEWIYPWGNVWAEYHAVYFDISDNVTADVGSRPEGASWVGALDMSGNVWEWVSSYYKNYPYDISHENDSDVNNYRVLRGGSFTSYSDYLRIAYRYRSFPVVEYNNFGFRCARH